ncbi:serine hydrolase [Spirosoma sp. BT702]|uniref:Serine hydrolase n=1 Tax=Spirosoma profusum TaxID=2771354 RepID=A0A926XWQ8_9BACT|nr:serine hydrolase [Spirosoma profusum]MBD2701979.1 serine hydrolase [Spirosoma profusum]
MRSIKIITLLISLISWETGTSQDKKSKLSELMKAYHSYNMFDGAVLVAENGKVIYKDAFGLANREWNIPNTTDTKFMIGSVSKPLTAVLMLLQVQKGLIKLDKTIEDYLPEFKNKPAAKVTISQLLNHTSGIPNYDIINDFFPRISRQHYTREDYLKTFIDSSLAFKPGTQYAYSSWGYFTLGYIMERVTKKSYAQLMSDDIFNKIGMRNSGSYYHTQIIPKRATGYDYSFGGYTSSDFRDQSNTMGTGDIYSTVDDLFKFHMALTDNTLLNKELTTEMFTSGIAPANYGYGWFNKQFKYTATDSVASNFHLGMTDGFISFIRRIPSTKSLVVILCNSSPTDFFGITTNLYKILYNKPVSLKEPAHKKMEVFIEKLGTEKAVVEYKKMKIDTAHYYIDWISMNFIAQQLLALKRYEDAKVIAENNVNEFPNKDLMLVTMGNVYLALNKKEDAVRFYKKALQITPTFEEAKNRLKGLGSQ